jgi:DNA-binding YbaB/EbfC family protein
MTQNPFEELGGLSGAGGFDMGALLEQAQQMQAALTAASDRLAEAEVTGTVGSGSVSVTVSGVGELRRVEIRAGEFDGSDTDQLADLGDLIVAAYRDAKSQADELAAASLGPISGGLGGGLGGFGDLANGLPDDGPRDDGMSGPGKLGF